MQKSEQYEDRSGANEGHWEQMDVPLTDYHVKQFHLNRCEIYISHSCTSLTFTWSCVVAICCILA